jgi:hypothetical protein
MRRKRDWESCKYSIAIHGSEKLDDPFDIRTNGFYCYGCRNKEIVDLNVYPIEMRNEDGSDPTMLYTGAGPEKIYTGKKVVFRPIKIAVLYEFAEKSFIEGRELDEKEKSFTLGGKAMNALKGCTHCRFYKK